MKPESASGVRQQSPVEKTREKILIESVFLFSRKGFAGTSVRDISRQAGMTPASLYNYFENKDALYRAVLARCLEPMVDKVDQFVVRENLDKGVYELVELVMASIAEHPYSARLIALEVASGSERLDVLAREWMKPMVRKMEQAFKVAWSATDGRSAWSLEEAPIIVFTWMRIVFSHFSMAPLLEVLLGRDPLSKECLAAQTQIMLKLAHSAGLRGWSPEEFLPSQGLLTQFDDLKAGVRKPKLAKKTRERILNEALIQFSAKGFAGTSIRDIATETDLNPASLYNHFANKEDLYREVLIVGLEPSNLLLGKLATSMGNYEAISEAIIDTMSHLADHPHLPRLIAFEVASGGKYLEELSPEWANPFFQQVEREFRTSNGPVDQFSWTAKEAPLILTMWMHLVFSHFAMAPLTEIVLGRDPLSKEFLVEQTQVLLKLVRMMLDPRPDQ
jgi:AcrR family transcriptional regulator